MSALLLTPPAVGSFTSCLSPHSNPGSNPGTLSFEGCGEGTAQPGMLSFFPEAPVPTREPRELLLRLLHPPPGHADLLLGAFPEPHGGLGEAWSPRTTRAAV